MPNWFETKITYPEVQDDGRVKKVTEAYLVQAETFTEAEARTIQELGDTFKSPIAIKAAKRTRIVEIFNDPFCVNAKWYQVKWGLITLDDSPCKRGMPPVEKRITAYSMVEAENVEKALIRFHDNMKTTVMEYDIMSISETPIYEVYPTATPKLEDVNDGTTE